MVVHRVNSLIRMDKNCDKIDATVNVRTTIIVWHYIVSPYSRSSYNNVILDEQLREDHIETVFENIKRKYV